MKNRFLYMTVSTIAAFNMMIAPMTLQAENVEVVSSCEQTCIPCCSYTLQIRSLILAGGLGALAGWAASSRKKESHHYSYPLQTCNNTAKNCELILKMKTNFEIDIDRLSIGSDELFTITFIAISPNGCTHSALPEVVAACNCDLCQLDDCYEFQGYLSIANPELGIYQFGFLIESCLDPCFKIGSVYIDFSEAKAYVKCGENQLETGILTNSNDFGSEFCNGVNKVQYLVPFNFDLKKCKT